MTPEKIISVTKRYSERLEKMSISPKRMAPQKTMAELHDIELLQHAYYLCENVIQFAQEKDRWDKTNRHFAALQMILSFAGIYSLEELMDHNRPT